MSYTAPEWVNGQAPAINAERLNDLCGTVERLDSAKPVKWSSVVIAPGDWSSKQATVEITNIQLNEVSQIIFLVPFYSYADVVHTSGIYLSAVTTITPGPIYQITVKCDTVPASEVRMRLVVIDVS